MFPKNSAFTEDPKVTEHKEEVRQRALKPDRPNEEHKAALEHGIVLQLLDSAESLVEKQPEALSLIRQAKAVIEDDLQAGKES